MEPFLLITQMEARHLVNLLQEVILRPDHLKSTHDIVSGTEVTTEDLFTKLVDFSTRMPEAG